LPKRQGQRNQNEFFQSTISGASIAGIRKTAQTSGSGVADSLSEGENNNFFQKDLTVGAQVQGLTI
jgi:hypothetical protein